MTDSKEKCRRKNTVMTAVLAAVVFSVSACGAMPSSRKEGQPHMIVKEETGRKTASVGSDADFSVSKKPDKLVESSVITRKPTPTPTNTPTPTPTPTNTPTPTPKPSVNPKPSAAVKPTKAPEISQIPPGKDLNQPLSYYEEQFAGDCFIGDSRTDDLFVSMGISTADFLCKTGLNVKSALNEDKIWSSLKRKTYRNIYIEFGVNELGWQSLDYFEKYYVQLINKVKELQPSANIYVQSIIPVSQRLSDKGGYETLANVEKFNKRVINAASSTSVAYLDVTLGICGSSRVLPSDASYDGVHPNKRYNRKWLDYIIANR